MRNWNDKSPASKTLPCKVCGKDAVVGKMVSGLRAICSDECRALSRNASFAKYRKTDAYKAAQKRHREKPERKAYYAKWAKGYMPDYCKNKRATDPTFRLLSSVRARMGLVLRGSKKQAPTVALIGCSPDELRAHLESKFKPGMSWETYGVKGWHIDHERPLASFVLIKPDGTIDEAQLRLAMHYTNLQPLWYWENIAKSDNYVSA